MSKAILIVGGRGTRVHALTKSILPKSLCRLSKKVSKPLVGYQLKQLQKDGFYDIFLIFQEHWQVALFEQSVRIREVPPLRYSFFVKDCNNHPLNAFRNREVLNFIAHDDFLLSYGDIFYSSDLLRNFKKLSILNNTSVASIMHSRSRRWKKGENWITFTENRNHTVTGFDISEQRGFTIHAPFYFQNRALQTIREELQNDAPRTPELMKRLIKKEQLSVFESKFLVNMNTPSDVKKLEKKILQYRW